RTLWTSAVARDRFRFSRADAGVGAQRQPAFADGEPRVLPDFPELGDPDFERHPGRKRTLEPWEAEHREAGGPALRPHGEARQCAHGTAFAVAEDADLGAGRRFHAEELPVQTPARPG